MQKERRFFSAPLPERRHVPQFEQKCVVEQEPPALLCLCISDLSAFAAGSGCAVATE